MKEVDHDINDRGLPGNGGPVVFPRTWDAHAKESVSLGAISLVFGPADRKKLVLDLRAGDAGEDSPLHIIAEFVHVSSLPRVL